MSKKIIYLSPYFWPEEIGSAPYCTDLAVWLSNKGHDVSVQSFRPHYPSIREFLEWTDGSRDKEKHAGVAITRVPIGTHGDGGFKVRLKNNLAFLILTVKRLIKGEFAKADIVIAYVPSIIVIYCAKLIQLFTGAEIVCVVHDIESGLARSLGIIKSSIVLKTLVFVEKIGLNFAQKIIVLTEQMKEELEYNGCYRPILVFPIWASVAEPVAAPVGRPILSYSGNFGKKQNLDQLLPLIKELSDQAPNVRIIMRGDGSERHRIECVVRDQGLSNTEFLPLAPNQDFMASLQSVHIHLVPQSVNTSKYAMPSKVFSIMAAGRPFICIAEKDSPLDVLAQSSGAGICIKPDDNLGLVKATLALINDPARQNIMGVSGREYIRHNMNREMILSAYEDLVLVLGGNNNLSFEDVDICGVSVRSDIPVPSKKHTGRNLDNLAVLSTRTKSSLEGAPSFSLKNRLFRLLWKFVWGVLASWTPAPLHGWRRFLLRLFGAKIGSGVRVYGSANIWYPPNLVMGEFSCIGWKTVIYSQAKITIGPYATVSQYAHIVTGTHEVDSPSFQLYTRPVQIGAYAWVSSGAFVGPGVNIGDGAVLGARGVAFQALDPWTIYVGNPAREIRKRINWRSEEKHQ